MSALLWVWLLCNPFNFGHARVCFELCGVFCSPCACQKQSQVCFFWVIVSLRLLRTHLPTCYIRGEVPSQTRPVVSLIQCVLFVSPVPGVLLVNSTLLGPSFCGCSPAHILHYNLSVKCSAHNLTLSAMRYYYDTLASVELLQVWLPARCWRQQAERAPRKGAAATPHLVQ